MQRTSRTTVRRSRECGMYDTETIYAIQDAGFLYHVGFVQENQQFVIPILCVRVGAQLYLHGSTPSRLLQPVEGACRCT